MSFDRDSTYQFNDFFGRVCSPGPGPLRDAIIVGATPCTTSTVQSYVVHQAHTNQGWQCCFVPMFTLVVHNVVLYWLGPVDMTILHVPCGPPPRRCTIWSCRSRCYHSRYTYGAQGAGGASMLRRFHLCHSIFWPSVHLRDHLICLSVICHPYYFPLLQVAWSNHRFSYGTKPSRLPLLDR